MSSDKGATESLKRSASNSSLGDNAAGTSKKQDSTTEHESIHIINSVYGIAEIKPEYLVETSADSRQSGAQRSGMDYDIDEEGADERLMESIAAEGGPGKKNNKRGKKGKNKGERGQNKNRDNTQQRETVMLCGKYKFGPGLNEETEPLCKFGDKCKFIHDLEKYLEEKTPDISTEYFSVCPIYQELGFCPMGFKCKFLDNHVSSTVNGDTKDIKLTFDVSSIPKDYNGGEVNCISLDNKFNLMKKRSQFPDTEWIVNIQESFQQQYNQTHLTKEEKASKEGEDKEEKNVKVEDPEVVAKREEQKKIYLEYKDTRYWSREKNRPLNYNRKMVLSPLTTVGNLPYRRLMKSLGCDVTYSEMALSLPLIQGANSEWALMKSHRDELPGFGIQIATNKPWQAGKACEAIKKLLPNASETVNEINLNCGCPIDLLYKQGSGSGLLDNPGRLLRILNTMSYSSDDIPVSCKLRIGTKDDAPLAKNLIKRIVNETDVSCITLHGRTRQQRYTRASNWQYIKESAQELRKVEVEYHENQTENHEKRNNGERIQFLGNGDLYYWKDWYDILDECPEMDSIMVARGALIKPWIFEEIQAQQSLDKTSSERLQILSQYLRNAMDHWGTDEYGLLQCRRFFLDFMSFFHRYIPIGLLSRQNKLNERPPFFQGRDDMETLLSSSNVNDWIKVSEMFLGKTPSSFQYTPKHKSNSYINV